jgi:peptide/nickel transport system permease protein
MHLAPGDVADTISQSMGGADEELLIEIRKDYGLDQPYFQQLATYIGKVLRFDLGHSFFFNEPVSKLVLERDPCNFTTRNNCSNFSIIARCGAWCLLSPQT